MKIETHPLDNLKIAEVVSADLLINNADDALDLLGNLYYQGFDSIVLYAHNITPGFFDLKNGMAGEVLQKFSNYRVRLSIVGDFSKYTSQPLHDFIYESNKGKHINFVNTLAAAVRVLTKK